MSEMVENKKYDCSECANKRTPICKDCSAIEHTDGTSTKPKHFVSLGVCDLSVLESARKDSLKRDLADFMRELLSLGEPVPIALLMLYNDIPREN